MDLRIETPDGFHSVEFKKSASPKADDVKHFDVLTYRNLKLKKGALVCNCPDILPLPKKIPMPSPDTWI